MSYYHVFHLESKNSMLEAEVRSLQRRMLRRDNEILKQERELHKLRVSCLMKKIDHPP